MWGRPVCVEASKTPSHVLRSVTKWVHLHGGDAALQALFAEVGRMLVPGGIFVLEPQPWRSYRQAERKLVS